MDKTTYKMPDLTPGRFVKVCRVSPSGSLEVRQDKDSTIRFYWRGAVGKKTLRVAIGIYDRKAPPKSLEPTKAGYSLSAAKRAAENIGQEHKAHPEGYEGVRADDAARIAHETALKAAKSKTLADLLDDYCDHQKAIGRQAHRDARSIFQCHIKDAAPEVAMLPAADVTPEHIADLMRALLEAGKGRTANKLRSYVRAAYQMAKSARTNPALPVKFKAYGITHNPAADTVPDTRQNKADKFPLMPDEMIQYWNIIQDVPGVKGAVLRLHLLTGGQRIAQLVALRSEDIGKGQITLSDGKGRPGSEPRAHTLPLLPDAKKALEDAASGGVYALSTDGGATHIAPTTVSKWAKEVVGDQIPDFALKRVRSGVETLLASCGVSLEVRGRLQSHGIAGVQARHYDGHDYLPEKRAALLTLLQAVKGARQNVVQIFTAA